MKVKLEIISENEDGSAIATVELDRETINFLSGEGLMAIIERAIESSESYIAPKEDLVEMERFNDVEL
jgi:hypothetical protein